MMPDDSVDAAAIHGAWNAVMQRAAQLLPYFAENLLKVSASSVARELGFRRADVLARYLIANRLPPFELLRNGIYVVQLLECHERGGNLAQWARARGHYESTYYHFIQNATGFMWTDVVAQGTVRRKVIELRRWDSFTGEKSV